MAQGSKMYVGALAQETTTEGLRQHFSRYGELSDCIVMVDKVSGQSRGFGFVTFVDPSAMNAAIGNSNNIDGREVFCKKAVREHSASAPPSGAGGMYNTVKVFVGGLPASCDHAKLTEFFGRFGTIEDAVVMMDNQTQRHRGFGYVTFSEMEAVEQALQNYASNQIDGKWVEVKRCIPQNKMAPGQSFKGKGKGGGCSGGCGGGGAGCYGSAGGGCGGPAPQDYGCGGCGMGQAYGQAPYGMQQQPGAYAQPAYGMGAYGGGCGCSGCCGGCGGCCGGCGGCCGGCGGCADPYAGYYGAPQGGAYGGGTAGAMQGYAAPMGAERYAPYGGGPY